MQTASSQPLRLAAAAVALTLGTWAGAADVAAFIVHGNFKKMMHTGDTDAKVALSALAQRPGHWGVGALAGLKGEVLQADGKLLVSRGSAAQGRTEAPRADDAATLFAGAMVTTWQALVLPQAMDVPQLQAFVEAQARAAGHAAHAPFAFRVQGRYPLLTWHVVTGEGGGHGAAAGEGQGAGGHANTASGMKVFKEAGASGLLVGVYSGAALEGVASHPGERLHLHYASADLARSGHVDALQVEAGATLWLPAR